MVCPSCLQLFPSREQSKPERQFQFCVGRYRPNPSPPAENAPQTPLHENHPYCSSTIADKDAN